MSTMLCADLTAVDRTISAQLEASCKRYVYIMLVRYPDALSKVFRFFSRGQYSHASIGISDSDGVFYSYVIKGFRKEFPIEHPTFKKHEVPCRLYRIEISDELYHVADALLNDHAKQARSFKYNSIGVFLCLMRIVYTRRNRYFCSQFVSEMLEQLGIVPLKKHSALYTPDDFTKLSGLDLCFSGCLSGLSAGLLTNHFQLA